MSELNETKLTELLNDAESFISLNTDNMEQLREEFTSLENIAQQSVAEVNSTKETIKVIQDIAMNTRILGFNAYIEAARAKENGKSFGVITQEIRDLADQSKESADKIEEAMNSISKCTERIDKQIQNTEKTLIECIENIKKFSDILNNFQKNDEDSDEESEENSDEEIFI